MIIDHLSFSLKDLFNFYDHKFIMKTQLLLTIQLISHVKAIHAKSFIHENITSDNLLMSIQKQKHQINIINFDFVRQYLDSDTHVHISCDESKHIISTVCYVSLNTHLELKQSQQD